MKRLKKLVMIILCFTCLQCAAIVIYWHSIGFEIKDILSYKQKIEKEIATLKWKVDYYEQKWMECEEDGLVITMDELESFLKKNTRTTK